MSVRYKFLEETGLHYCTLTVMGWIDLFSRQVYRNILLDSLRFCIKNKGLVMHSYVVMSNHIHLIVSAKEGCHLSAIFRDMKSFTAKAFLAEIKRGKESRREWLLHQFSYYAKQHKRSQEYMVWQADNHPIHLWSAKVIKQKVQYIHLNPVRAGLVGHPSDWVYSSAIDYEGEKGLLDVVVLDAVYTL